MLKSVQNVGQNSYNTSFGCKSNAKNLVTQLSKKTKISPEQFDKIVLTDPLANAVQKVKVGLGSKAELREVIMRKSLLKVCNNKFIKVVSKLLKK